MDKLLNEFTVNRPIDEAWAVLTDVERIAPCMPGAQLQEIEGDVYRGVVKIKLGAIATQFKGQARFVERDDAAHRAVLHAEGRDTGGKGNADATITATAERVDEGRTKVVVETDLRITGKVAQFGRGIMADVSKKLMAQFAHNLDTMLAEGEPASTAAPAEREVAAETPVPATVGAATAAAAAAATTGSTTTAEATGAASANGRAATVTAEPADTKAVRKIDGPAAEPIELSDVAGGAIVKRLLPALGGLLLVFVVLRRLRRR